MEEIRKYHEIRNEKLSGIGSEDLFDVMTSMMIENLEKGIPDDVKKDLREMALLHARIDARMSACRAVPHRDIVRFNELCYKRYGKRQDGEEFEKQIAPGEKSPLDRYPSEARFDFGTALRFLKEGKKLSRDGWNGKGQYIELATKINYDTVNHPDYARGSSTGPWVRTHRIPEHDAIAFVGTSGIQVGWLASQADMLSEDWHVVEG